MSRKKQDEPLFNRHDRNRSELATYTQQPTNASPQELYRSNTWVDQPPNTYTPSENPMAYNPGPDNRAYFYQPSQNVVSPYLSNGSLAPAPVSQPSYSKIAAQLPHPPFGRTPYETTAVALPPGNFANPPNMIPPDEIIHEAVPVVPPGYNQPPPPNVHPYPGQVYNFPPPRGSFHDLSQLPAPGHRGDLRLPR